MENVLMTSKWPSNIYENGPAYRRNNGELQTQELVKNCEKLIKLHPVTQSLNDSTSVLGNLKYYPYINLDVMSYVILQAAAMVTPKSLKITKISCDASRIDSLKNTFEEIESDINEGITNILFMGTAESNAEKIHLLRRTKKASNLAEQLSNVRGAYVDIENIYFCKHLVVFQSNKYATIQSNSLILLVLTAIRLLGYTEDPELPEVQLLRKLNDLFANTTSLAVTEAMSNSRTDFAEKVTDLIHEYVMTSRYYAEKTLNSAEVFLKKILEEKLQNLETELETLKLRVENKTEALRQAITELNNVQRDYAATKAYGVKDLEDKLNEAFTFIKSTCEYEPEFKDNGLIFAYKTPLYVNNPDDFDLIIKNTTSDEDLKNLLHMCFVTHEVELYTWASVHLNLKDNKCHKALPPKGNMPTNAIPQPHIMEFDCFGTHRAPILEALRGNNYAGAVEQILEAISGLNIYDATVLRRLCNRFTGGYVDKVQAFQNTETGEIFSFEEWKRRINENHTT